MGTQAQRAPWFAFTSHLVACLMGAVLTAVCLSAFAQPEPLTPPRLGYLQGAVSFQRAGGDWGDAQLNTPLAAGDSLYLPGGAALEIQIGSRAFVRAGGQETGLGLLDVEPDYLQFRVTTGQASFDLRSIPPGATVEIDTPQAVFQIDHTGYYRVRVDGDTDFITRRGGQATVIPAGGQALGISPAEEVVVRGGALGVEAYAAPELDEWDRWNYARTDQEIDAVSARFVPSGMYGAEALDYYGNWRVVPAYGPIWIPDDVAPGWAPYSDGDWIWDPAYGWTWVDAAPWGWAPFHYGRWVFIDGYWGWAPGPLVVRPVYAPALVAFFRQGSSIGWVALGWGEPVMPWWGRPGYRGVPHWAGWGGPRIVNNVVINRTTVVNVNRIIYRNLAAPGALAGVSERAFGRTRLHGRPMPPASAHPLVPLRGSLPVKPRQGSPAAGARPGVRPPPGVFSRPVLATRPPPPASLPRQGERRGAAQPSPAFRFTAPPRRPEPVLPRPPLGTSNSVEYPRPPLSPRFDEGRKSPVARPALQGQGAPLSGEPGRAARRETTHLPPGAGAPHEFPHAQFHGGPAGLPGTPANRLYRQQEKRPAKADGNRQHRQPPKSGGMP